MANSVMMFDTLGYAPDHPDAAIAWQSVRKLLVVQDGPRPTASPAFRRSGTPASPATPWRRRASRDRCACDWLRQRQILDVVGDWAVRRPGLRPGGWAFQYANPHYPDVDDTAVVGMLLHRNGDPAYAAGDRPRPRVDHRHAVLAMTAAGARSSRRTPTSTSTTSRSPTTAPCSIRRPPT